MNQGYVLRSGLQSRAVEYIWRLVIEKNLRPFFATLKAQKVTTEKLKEYRRKRIAEGRTDATANRELSILRTAFHNGRKCTPPKVILVPFFPMTPETNVRSGFVSDEQYSTVLNELPSELKALFAVGYATGIRLGELKAIGWDRWTWNRDSSR
jgi:integrase